MDRTIDVTHDYKIAGEYRHVKTGTRVWLWAVTAKRFLIERVRNDTEVPVILWIERKEGVLEPV